MHVVNDRISIGTEIWNDLEDPWHEGEIIIAKPGYIWRTKWELGKPYIITKIQDEKSNLIAVYCDVARPVQAAGNGFTFIDLYLDVWIPYGQAPIIIDENELDNAVAASYITSDEAAEARRVASELITNVKNDSEFLNF